MVVEDDLRLAQMIKEFLEREGFAVDAVHRGDAAISRIQAQQPDLVILDVSLPGATGFDVCRAIRPQYSGIIMMLTARDGDIDQIVGLEIGADDYVIKPVEPRVLLARVRSLLRRRNGPANSATFEPPGGALRFGGLTVSSVSREVTLDGVLVDLTTSEFELLWLLAGSAGEILNRDAIFKRLYGREYDGLDRSVDVNVSRLRRKLDDDGAAARRIKTVRGRGYLFVADAWH